MATARDGVALAESVPHGRRVSEEKRQGAETPRGRDRIGPGRADRATERAEPSRASGSVGTQFPAGWYIGGMTEQASQQGRSWATPNEPSAVRVVGAVVLLLVVFGVVLRLMGRELLSDSAFGVWTGARTRNTSQWMADPYTFSHVLHGILFFGLLLPVARWLSLRGRFLVASLWEACWEVVENTPYVIDRYRTATASLDYYGDSIMNSTCDLAAAMVGFWLAARLGWKWMLPLVLVIELSMLVLIRDNLTLNVWMLLYPTEAVRQWQMR